MYHLRLRLIWLTCLGAVAFTTLHAQTPADYHRRLYYTCKVWGYAKYFHSKVTTCQVNWDAVLLSHLPTIKNCQDDACFNAALLSMLNAAGPMAIPTTPPYVIPQGYDINLDLNWHHDTIFEPAVQEILDTIRARFRPHPNCNVIDNSDYHLPSEGWFYFPDQLLTANNIPYPSEEDRLLIAFRYWNIIRYFNPNVNAADTAWDTTLTESVASATAATDYVTWALAFSRLVSALDDSHAYLSNTLLNQHFGIYYPDFSVDEIEDSIVITRVINNSQFEVGDIILELNNIPVDTLQANLSGLISGSTEVAKARDLCDFMLLRGPYNSTIDVRLSRNNVIMTIPTNRTVHINQYYNLLMNDPGASYSTLLPCDYGYVHMGRLTANEVPAMWDSLKNKQAIIFDLRNYPNETALAIAERLLPDTIQYARIGNMNPEYPGVLSHFSTPIAGIPSSSSPYTGRIYILVNQETQSQAETSAMILRLPPNAVVIGSQTAGADGEISTLRLPSGMNTAFTSRLFTYPDGTPVQRQGIQIDTIVRQTIAGVRNNTDDILDFVLHSCPTSITTVSNPHTVTISPNPSDGLFTFDAPAAGTIQIQDLSGRLLKVTAVSGNQGIDCRELEAGLYVLAYTSTHGQTATLKLAIAK